MPLTLALLSASSSSGGGSIVSLLFLPLMFVGGYFLLIRPQRRRQKAQVSLQSGLSEGDEVITTSGMYGFITGFGINVPTLNITSATGSSTDPDFKFLKAGVNATSLQGGAFDYAFSTSASQLHTVAASEIAVGLGATQSATFTINLTGTGLGGLTALQISKELSAPTAVPFSVRFRSTNVLLYPGNNSPDGDKVPFRVIPTPTPLGVPAPAGLVLGLIGVGGMIGRSLRRKTAAAVTA